MQKLLIIYFALNCAIGQSLAQDTYHTRHATFSLIGELDQEPLKLETRELSIALDYETANIIIRLPVGSLLTQSGSLKALLESSHLEAVFEGKLGMEFVNTESHPPLQFTAEGWLTIGNSRSVVRGSGDLYHIGNNSDFSCLLSLTLDLDLNELNFDLPIAAGLGPEFEAVITQALLHHNKH